MGDVVRWEVSQQFVLGLALGLFGFLGYRRGVNRELLAVLGIVLGMVLSHGIAVGIEPQVNRFYKLAKFALQGGLTSGDPGAVWQTMRNHPPLIQSAQDRQGLEVVVFLGIVAFSYLLGQGRLPTAGSPILRLLGFFAGCINGFLVTYHLLPIMLPKPEAVIAVPSGELQRTLTDTETVARMVIFLVFLLIAFGLYSASRGRRGQ